jgi:hypothetical protein
MDDDGSDNAGSGGLPNRVDDTGAASPKASSTTTHNNNNTIATANQPTIIVATHASGNVSGTHHSPLPSALKSSSPQHPTPARLNSLMVPTSSGTTSLELKAADSNTATSPPSSSVTAPGVGAGTDLTIHQPHSGSVPISSDDDANAAALALAERNAMASSVATEASIGILVRAGSSRVSQLTASIEAAKAVSNGDHNKRKSL